MAEVSLDPRQPRGKQRWKGENFGCWYVQTTGIWKTVWMESVPESYLSALKLTPNLAQASLALEAQVEARIMASISCWRPRCGTRGTSLPAPRWP